MELVCTYKSYTLPNTKMTKFVTSFHIILRERDWALQSVNSLNIIQTDFIYLHLYDLPEDLTRIKQGMTDKRTNPPTDTNGSLNPPS